MKIKFHTIESAPEPVKADMEGVENAFGTVINLVAGFAASPAATKSYLALSGNLKTHGVLNPIEQQVVYICVSAANSCEYCVAAHSTVAGMVKMPDDILSGLREQRALPDARLEALRIFALAMRDQRGFMTQDDLEAFAKAGYEQAHLLDVITIMAQKTMSNYFNHIANTPLDEMFEAKKWQATAE